MSPRAPRVTGNAVIAALLRGGYRRRKQTGSHVRLEGPNGQLVTVTRTDAILKPKTLASVLRQAGLSEDDLRRLL
jgi:predicted RNA binding protein YcfA (HicA-like mRNA interferase family)